MAAIPQSRLIRGASGTVRAERAAFFEPRRNARTASRERLISATMRAFRLIHSPLIAIAVSCAAACGGGPPPAANTPEAAPAAEAAPSSSAAPAAEPKPAAEDEAWAGEKSDKAAGGAASEQPAAEPSSPDGKAPETRTMDVIRKLVMDNRKPARKCYEDARRDLKDLQGNVVIHFVLDPEGKVKSAELNQERSTLKSPAVVDCVIGVIKSIQFPKSSRGMETSANYPFNFTP